MKYCNKCNHKLIVGLRYCFNCGADANESKKNIVDDKSSKKVKPKSRLDAQLFDVFLK